MKYKIQRVIEKARIKPSLGFLFWDMISKLPFQVRGPVMRLFFSFEPKLPENLIFKRAETVSEIEQAFQIVQEAYLQRGLVSEQERWSRITKYHALPTTFILIAKVDHEVIATITVILDSSLKLPMEELWDLTRYRKKSARMAEFSNTAIKNSYRGQRGKLFLPMCAFSYQICHKVLGVDRIVAAFHPEVEDFYRCILHFDQIEPGVVKKYSAVKGAAAVAGILDVAKLPEKFFKSYAQKKDNRNIHALFTEENINFDVRQLEMASCSHFTFTPHLLEYFFKHRSEVIPKLSGRDRQAIAATYFYPAYIDTLVSDDELEVKNFQIQRKQVRISVTFRALMTVQGTFHTFRGQILEVSRLGFRMFAPDCGPMFRGQSVFVSILLSVDESLQFHGEVCWVADEYNQIGIILTGNVPPLWVYMIDCFENQITARIEESPQIRDQLRTS